MKAELLGLWQRRFGISPFLRQVFLRFGLTKHVANNGFLAFVSTVKQGLTIMGAHGLEPWTSALSGPRSNQTELCAQHNSYGIMLVENRFFATGGSGTFQNYCRPSEPEPKVFGLNLPFLFSFADDLLLNRIRNLFELRKFHRKCSLPLRHAA